MHSINGKAFVLAIIVLFVIIGGLLVYKQNQSDTKQLPTSVSEIDLSSERNVRDLVDNSKLSEKDLYKISDLFIIQSALYSFTIPKQSQYPANLLDLKTTTFGKIPYNDPDGKPYTYVVQNDKSDYVLSTILDNGNNYIVRGSTRKNMSAVDIYRKADIKSISLALNGYFMEHKQYPNSLADLIPAGWGLGDIDGQPYIPQDPITKEAYNYKAYNNNKDYHLSAQLDVGITYILRSGM